MAFSLLDNEVEELASSLRTCKIHDNEKFIIETELKLMDIHFNWNLHQVKPGSDNPKEVASELNRKLKEMLGDYSELSFKTFCSQLTLSQELVKYDTDSALKKVIECEPWVMSLKSGTCQEQEFVSISEAVEYIYLGCKAFALFKCGSIAEAKEVLQKVPNLKKMEEKQLSGIYGMKASAFMAYGLPGLLEALRCISIARSKHPTMAHWHFLTGTVMSRIRHVKYPFMIVSDEEENFYRTAYKLNEDKASYALFLAQITREKAFGLFQECRYDRENNKECLELVNKMNAEASSLYMEVMRSNQNDPTKLGRSAFGMVKLPEPHRRIDLAVQAIERALRIAPDNALVNHYAGLIYYRHVKDDYKGLQYLERAANLKNYSATLEWVKLKYSLDPNNYDPIPELTKALEYEDYASTTLTEMVSWYFFNKHDVFRAWDHLKKVTDDHLARSHKSPYLRMESPCNLFEVIFDEVKLMLAQGKYRNGREKETLLLMSKELQTVCPQSHPTQYSNFKAAILKTSDRMMIKDQKFTNYMHRRSEGNCDARYMQRGRFSSDRRSTSNFRKSYNFSSFNQNCLNIDEGKRGANPRRTRINIQSGSNNLEQTSSPVSKNNSKLDLAEGISMRNVSTHKLMGFNPEFKNSCSTRRPTFSEILKKPENYRQPKHLESGYSNLGKFSLNADRKRDKPNNNFSGSPFPEHANTYKNLGNASSYRKTQQPLYSLNIGPQATSSGTGNIPSEVKYDNFCKKMTQISLNLNNVTNDFSVNSGNQFCRKDESPSYSPKKGLQSLNYTNNL